jgi:hypothetical protein
MVENGVVNLFKGKVQLILFHKKHYWNTVIVFFLSELVARLLFPKAKTQKRQSADTILSFWKMEGQ